ncbi:hypothetical protein A0256_19720 [Mucilaginibacter sp. PAMC 26640]|nr:hypothetical protein A0256_19720 [Mucilaginibacter sp. PAMC 26640]
MIKEISRVFNELGIEIDPNSTDIVGYWDKNLRCKYANAAYFDWFGVSPKTMINKMHIKTLLGPLYTLNEPYIDAVLKGRVQVFSRDIPSPFGSIRHAVTTYSPAFEGDEIIGFYVHVEEATNNEKASKPSLDPMNGKAEKFLQVRDPIEEVRKSLASSLHETFPGISSLAKAHFISEAKLKTDFKARFGRGVFGYYRHLQMELAEFYIKERQQTKSYLAHVFNFTNITNFSKCYEKYQREKSRLKITEQLTKANDDRYKVFITQVPFAVAMLDHNMCFISASQKFISDYHLDHKPVNGLSINQVFPTMKSHWKKMHQLALRGKIQSGEDLTCLADGSKKWTRYDIRPWRNNENEIGGIIIFTEDITHLKRQTTC